MRKIIIRNHEVFWVYTQTDPRLNITDVEIIDQKTRSCHCWDVFPLYHNQNSSNGRPFMVTVCIRAVDAQTCRPGFAEEGCWMGWESSAAGRLNGHHWSFGIRSYWKFLSHPSMKGWVWVQFQDPFGLLWALIIYSYWTMEFAWQEGSARSELEAQKVHISEVFNWWTRHWTSLAVKKT